MIDVVYARVQTMLTLPDGTRVVVPQGSHWPSDDPVVRDRPELFSADPRYGMLFSSAPDGYDAPVEEATAVPGEKRSVRRS
jgi:hypothetical protein